jgi:hypothetical protein
MKPLTITLLLTFSTLTGFSQDSTVHLCCNQSFCQDLFTFLKGWQTLIAAIIVIIGWFVNSWLNRKAEIAKRRSEHRLIALKSFVDSIIFELSKGADKAFAKPDFKDELELARKNIQMYGYRNEIDIYEEFIQAINMETTDDQATSRRLQRVNDSIPKLTIILESLRTELGLENYKRKK